MSRYAERRDDNERLIVDALREAGCEVWQLCAKECADLLVYRPRTRVIEDITARIFWYEPLLTLLEVKDSAKPPSARKLTAKQQETHKTWPVHVCSTVAEALAIVRGGV